MKVVISDHPPYFLDLDAPTVGCVEVVIDGILHWRFGCPHCEQYHDHGPGEGHRLAHFGESSSPYWETGYNLARAEGCMTA